MSYRIAGGDFDTAGLATRRLKEHLVRIGVGAAAMRRAMIASCEAEMNVVIHARTGTLWARLGSGKLDLEIADEGPGIPNVDLALREGWSTASEKAREMGFGAGMGLPNIRMNSDLFDIETRIGRGTRIRSTILLGASEKSAGGSAPEGVETVGVARERCRKCLGRGMRVGGVPHFGGGDWRGRSLDTSRRRGAYHPAGFPLRHSPWRSGPRPCGTGILWIRRSTPHGGMDRGASRGGTLGRRCGERARPAHFAEDVVMGSAEAEACPHRMEETG